MTSCFPLIYKFPKFSLNSAFFSIFQLVKFTEIFAVTLQWLRNEPICAFLTAQTQSTTSLFGNLFSTTPFFYAICIKEKTALPKSETSSSPSHLFLCGLATPGPPRMTSAIETTTKHRRCARGKFSYSFLHVLKMAIAVL